MARPERHDVDYFPFWIKDGRTLFLLESKYGCKGTGFFTNLMRFLCATPDHYFCVKEETDRLYFYAKCHCDEVSGAEMMDIMAKTGKIDAALWVSAGVIVSEDLLRSLSYAYRKRSNDIITIAEIAKKHVSSDVNGVSGDVNGLKGGDKPQSKVKKSKVKKRGVFIPPSLDDVISYFKEKGYAEDAARRAFDYYHEGGWIDGQGNKVNNWKMKMIAVWFKDDNRSTEGNESWRVTKPELLATLTDEERGIKKHG